MPDEFAARYGDLLSGVYDCVDRIVLNAYFTLGHSPGGFRVWWRRWHGDSDEDLDNAHLMRMAGRFSRRVRGWAAANGHPRHRLQERRAQAPRLPTSTSPPTPGSASACSWSSSPVPLPPRGTCSAPRTGVIRNLAKKQAFVNHYSFHILDPDVGARDDQDVGTPALRGPGHLERPRVRRLPRPGRRHSLRQGRQLLHRRRRPAGLAQVADTLSHPAAVGRLGQVCDRWIYTACLCFGLDLADQERSLFRYSYSIYQVEYSRNLLFRSGARMDAVFDAVVDRTRSRLDVPDPAHPVRRQATTPDQPQPTCRLDVAAVIETPQYGLTIFKVHFGALTLKGYTKGEHVLRFEAVCHNTKALRVGRVLDRFPDIVASLAAMLERFCTTVDCVDVTFIPDGILDELPQPSMIGRTRVGGVDLNKPRTRATLAAVIALAAAPDGFTVAELADKVHADRRPRPTTPPAKPPTTCASSAATTWSSSPAGAAATTSHPKRPAPSPRSSPCANTSSPRSSPASAAPAWAASPPTGPPSTATTRSSASACRTSSTTSPSPHTAA